MKYKTVMLGGLLSILISLNLVILSLAGVFGEEVQARTRNAMTITTLTTVTHTNSGTFTNTGAFVASSTAAVTDTLTVTGAFVASSTGAITDTLTITGAVDANGTSNFQGAMTLQATLAAAGNANLDEDVILGDAVGDLITINGAATVTAASLDGDATSSADWSGAVAVAIPVKADCGISCTSGSLCIDTTEDQFQGCNGGTFALIHDFSP